MLTRLRVPEMMDDPGLDYASHVEALQGLQRLNSLSSSASSIWREVRKLHKPGSKPVRVLDIASGGGDIPIALCEHAAFEHFAIDCVGADISPQAVSYAGQAARAKNSPASFMEIDVLNQPLPDGFDVIVTSLFTHHLDPPDVIQLLRKMASSAKQMVLINDLVRSEVSLALVWLASRLVTKSPVVRFDATASVKASFTREEFLSMGQSAGLTGCAVKRCPPCRQLFVWKKND